MNQMTKSKKLEIPFLLNPPLLEAIFELRWELQIDQNAQRARDPAYPMLFGRLYERMKREFPIVEDLPTVQVHPETSPWTVRHRIRKERDGWPLIQVGPGIITVNEGKAYSWSSFKSQVLKLIPLIAELYPTGVPPLNYIKAEIRFVNAIHFDPNKEDPMAFLADQLHVKVQLDENLFAQNKINPKAEALTLNLAYPLLKPVGHWLMSVGLGQANEKPAYLIQNLIQSVGETTPQELTSFEEWMEEAHKVAQNTFATLCSGQLMQRFTTV